MRKPASLNLLRMILSAALLCVPLYGQKLGLPLPQHNKVMDEFLHTAWTVNEGAPSALAALTQTTDGCLWLGSPTGSVRLTICDDGRGLDRETLNRGRTGHRGLSGMRERAQHMGARLSIWSNPGAGTR